jgi:serralysin
MLGGYRGGYSRRSRWQRPDSAGGSGADTFVFGKAWGRDVVTDFQDGTDRLNFHDTGVAGLQDLSLAAVGSNALITWHGNEVLLIGVRVADLGPADFIF